VSHEDVSAQARVQVI